MANMAASHRAYSNLGSFVDSVTPSVEARFAPKASFQDLNTTCSPTTGKDMVKYFTLSDFWMQYYEWSACGAAVPIRLKDGKFVIQYYAPTLSAIQIYTRKVTTRSAGEESESEHTSDDSGSEKISRSWGSSVSEGSSDNEATEQLGDLYFQFLDNSSPYTRLPLLEKVHELAVAYPGLMSYKSVELSPASWISVAWYPIYHTPGQTNIEELSTRFLTYHCLSSCIQDNTPADRLTNVSYVVHRMRLRKRVSFTPFALATSRMRKSFWVNPETGDQEMLNYLMNAAGSFLKEQNVHHNDYIFFNKHWM